MENNQYFEKETTSEAEIVGDDAHIVQQDASLSEGGGVCEANDGGSSIAPTCTEETPSVSLPADSSLKEGAFDTAQPDCETVGAGVPDRPSAEKDNLSVTPTASAMDSDQPEAEIVGDDASLKEGAFGADPTYVDLNRDEFVAFRMLTARLLGPLRMRKATLIVAVLCSAMLGGYALFEWLSGLVPTPDPVLLVGAVLTLVPALILCVYMPWRIKTDTGKQYDRSVQAGVDYCGELVIYPDCVEKVGGSLTAHVRLDERSLFVETPTMMVLMAPGVPAIVLPARCLTDGMAQQVRQAAQKLPPRNRRFLGRLIPGGQVVPPPSPKAKPVEKWVTTFTYTAEEYAIVLRGIIQQHFWRMAPLLALVSVMGSLAFGYNGESLVPCIGYFVVFMAVLLLFNLVLPLRRVKAQCAELSPHDMTMQVRMDTMCIRAKLPKGGETMVLWCDVEHVYEREDFVEIVHNKQASLFIPKRCVEDLDALDAIIQACRGEQ